MSSMDQGGGPFPPEPRSRSLRLLGILSMIAGAGLVVLAAFIDPLTWFDEWPSLGEVMTPRPGSSCSRSAIASTREDGSGSRSSPMKPPID